MKYNCKLILIFFFSFLSSFGQDKLALDSLTSQLQSTSVKVKVKALNELCRLYTGTDNKKAMYFAKQALQISVKAKNALLIGQSQNRLGTIYDYIGVLDSANINYLSALKIFEDLNDKSGIAAVYQNIGVMYYFQNDLEKAIVYYSKAIDLRNETNELDFVAKLQNNIAVILRRQEKYDEAIAYYNKALAIKLKFNDNEAIASSYANLGTAYLYKKDFVNARIFFEKALTINTKLNSKINLAGNYFSLGELFFNQGKYNEARENTHRSIELATEAQSNDVLYNDYDLLWQIDTAIGDYKSAASNVHIAGTYKAKVFKNEKAQAVEKLNVLYETEKKDKEIITLNAEQEKEKIWTQLLLIGFGLVIIILMITAVYFKKLQAKNKLLLFQKKEIEDKTQQLNQQASEIAQYRSQMNPHFIFNALVSIQKFILKENKFNAVDYLTRLSKLMRLTLYNSEKEYISIKDEKQFLEFYLGFEQARFDNLFIYQFNIEKDIDEENTLLPPMIIQPFIENAIKHGLSPRSSGGELLISIYKRTARPHSYLYVEIKDNGVGRKEANNNKTNSEGGHISKGIDITINRIKSTCSANGLPDTDCFEIMDVNDNSISTGTLIKIKLPLIENF